MTKLNDTRERLTTRLIELIDQHGSRKVLCQRTGTTEQYISMLCNRKLHPSLNVLLSILHECGYDLQIIQTQQPVYKLLNKQTEKTDAE